MNLGGLAGLSGAYGGYQEAESNDLRNRLLRAQAGKSEYELGGMQGGDAVASNTLRTIFGPGGSGIGGLGGIGQGPQGSAPMPLPQPPAQMPPLPPQPMGGQPASAAPPPGGGPQASFDSRFAPSPGPALASAPQQLPPMAGPGMGAGMMPPAGTRPMLPALMQRYPGAQSAGRLPQGGPPPQTAPPPQQMPFTPQQQPQGAPQGQPMGGMQTPQMMDWRSLFQAAIKSNPGASPQALIRGVDGLVHLLNPIERAQWAEQRAMFSQMMQMANFDFKKGKFEYEEQKQQDEAKDIVAGMKNGTIPPTMQGLYRMRPFVEAEAKREHDRDPSFNLSKLQLQWAQAMREISALNSPRQAQFMGLARSAVDTIGELKALAQTEGMGRLADLNALQLEAKARTGDQDAIKYIEVATALRDEMATIVTQGYAPTESAWKQAFSLINGNYGVKALNAQIDELEKILNFRIRAYQELGGGYSMGAGNTYLDTKPIPTVGGTGAAGGGSDPLGLR